MWLYGKLGNRLLSMRNTIFLQAVGFLIHRLMAVGCNQLIVGIIILPSDISLVASLPVMPSELCHQVRLSRRLLYLGGSFQNGTGNTISIQMVFLVDTVVCSYAAAQYDGNAQ